MIAFHGMKAVQELYVGRAKMHRAADEIMKGVYVGTQADGRPGYCNVGCLIHSNDHSAFERDMGVPLAIAYLSDRIFEGLPDPDFKDFPTQFINAIPLGADLSRVIARFSIWLLSDPEQGVMRFADERGKAAIEGVVALYERVVAGDLPTGEAWESVAKAASTAADAAEARAADDTAYAASVAVDSAAAAVDAAADAVAYAAADVDTAYRNMRDKLLKLLAAAPIVEVGRET